MGALLALVPIRIWLTGLAGAGLVVAGWYLLHSAEEQGADKVRTQIEQQDRGAANAAAKARETRRACVDGGGRWDVTDGSCHAQ